MNNYLLPLTAATLIVFCAVVALVNLTESKIWYYNTTILNDVQKRDERGNVLAHYKMENDDRSIVNLYTGPNGNCLVETLYAVHRLGDNGGGRPITLDPNTFDHTTSRWHFAPFGGQVFASIVRCGVETLSVFDQFTNVWNVVLNEPASIPEYQMVTTGTHRSMFATAYSLIRVGGFYDQETGRILPFIAVFDKNSNGAWKDRAIDLSGLYGYFGGYGFNVSGSAVCHKIIDEVAKAEKIAVYMFASDRLLEVSIDLSSGVTTFQEVNFPNNMTPGSLMSSDAWWHQTQDFKDENTLPGHLTSTGESVMFSTSDTLFYAGAFTKKSNRLSWRILKHDFDTTTGFLRMGQFKHEPSSRRGLVGCETISE